MVTRKGISFTSVSQNIVFGLLAIYYMVPQIVAVTLRNLLAAGIARLLQDQLCIKLWE